LDLAAAVTITICDTKPVWIPTGIQGPVVHQGTPTAALLMGRSSAFMKGLEIAVGLFDPDYTGEIQIMAKTAFPLMVIPEGRRIAQLVPLPVLAEQAGKNLQERGSHGFGSTGGLALLTLGFGKRPVKNIVISLNGQ
ncbi:POK9 protein, partial [Bombycilla garrulus]|nr:POK9 protein [Bombycilla garrulus]